MFGTYAVHFPLTDFAVSLLVVGAFIDVLSRVFARAAWQTTVDWLLLTGVAGVLVTVASGFWLVSVQVHPNDDTLALHHAFAYATSGAVTIAVVARALQRRFPRLSWLRTIALVLAAFLVACAAFVGGSMSHGGHRHSHDAEPEPSSEPAPPTVP